MDVLSASFNDNKIAWYENTGDGNFGSQQIITTNTLFPNSVYAEDLDGDEDVDVLSASENDGKIAWYENDGNGIFGPQIIIAINIDARLVYSTDIDGDEDMDVLFSSFNAGLIAWYENDGDGNFGSQQFITNGTPLGSVYATDIDSDGDMDVLSGEIAWYENDGEGIFGSQQIIDNFDALSVYAEDIDGDGDMDVLAGKNDPSSGSGILFWFENLHPLSINENAIIDISVFPSPTSGILNIQSTIPITHIEVYNQLGQLVLSNSNKNNIDISRVSQGIYFIKILDENGTIGTQKVVKK